MSTNPQSPKERAYQAWLHRVDLILFYVHDTTHEDYTMATWKAFFNCGYLPSTAIYEVTGV